MYVFIVCILKIIYNYVRVGEFCILYIIFNYDCSLSWRFLYFIKNILLFLQLEMKNFVFQKLYLIMFVDRVGEFYIL